MTKSRREVTRRRFLQSSAAGVVAVTIVPRNVLGQGETPPSEEIGGALIGCGGRGGGTFGCLGPGVRRLASCDVKYKDRCDNQTYYVDFRRLLERKDIDVVAIATHPGWHALISIAAMEAGKDVVCEKPMCRFIAEGRAVANAEKRFGRVFQTERKGGYSPNLVRKIFESGLLKKCDSVLVRRGGFKVKGWSGMVKYQVQEVPETLDWNMYCGPAPLRPYQGHRFGGTHRGYWDYEGGGLSDMAHHHLHGLAYQFGRDLTSPVEVIPYAPPVHPECCGLWGWCELKYADGFTLVLDSGEWGEPYPGKDQHLSEADLLGFLSEEDRKKLDEMPDPQRQPFFEEAIHTRVPTGGNAERSHRVATIYHLANVAFRCGRPLKFDPDTEQVIGDEEANRLVNQPMRAPWRL
ncbi:MAG TPA: Gfo/Idh/MocA family oxidoreductase [Thermoguttaceae bacterium]|nr:Gfo/Idh/MocA family oxidoreductase [Thermoguttaceae bacterium]